MTNADDYAYPSKLIDGDGYEDYFTGLTKREYFAGLAMQSILTYSKNHLSRIASDSVEAADTLINELNKQKP